MVIKVRNADVQRGDILLGWDGKPNFEVEWNHPARAKNYRVFTGKRLRGDGVTAGGHKDDIVTVERS